VSDLFSAHMLEDVHATRQFHYHFQCQWWSGQCHAKHAANVASVHNTCLNKISVLKLGVCSKINACYIFVCRYAKIRTSKFRKVVRRHTEGTVGNIIWILLEIDFFFKQWKNIWKSFKNWQSYRYEFGVLLFGDTVYIIMLLQLACCKGSKWPRAVLCFLVLPNILLPNLRGQLKLLVYVVIVSVF